MKHLKRGISVCLVLILLFSICAAAIPASAATAPPDNYKRKVVSIVFDNSFSMVSPLIGTDSRYQYAKYALQTLIALLDPRDTLDIILMNINEFGKNKINVDLNGNRGDALRNTMEMIGEPSGSTPVSSIDRAIKSLTEHGMKKAEDVVSADGSVEYWLIILTDGLFENGAVNIEDVVHDSIVTQEYYALRTIYLAFDKDAKDLSQNTDISGKIPFTAYKATEDIPIAGVMQQIASQLSGRFKLEGDDDVHVNGKTVTVNLSSNGYSMNSVSVIAQNFGGKLESAKYNGNPLVIDQRCELDSMNLNNMRSGYSAVLKPPSGYYSGGSLELTFSEPVSPDNLSVLVSPAIYIEPYITYEGKEISPQNLSASCNPGDEISFGYRAYDAADKKQIDLATMFGNVTANVTYSSETKPVGGKFALAAGRNDATVTVNVMDGKYVLYGSLFCDVKSTLAVNCLSSPATLSQYELTVNSRGFEFELIADGKKAPFDSPNVSYTVRFGNTDVTSHATVENGILRYVPQEAHIGGSELAPGQKQVTVTVTSRAGNAAPATATATFDLQKTTYSVEAVSVGAKKEVERFNVSASHAVLYFRVLCDGASLNEEQLRSALEKGELKWNTAFALKFFLLPCKTEVQVETVNGETYLACHLLPYQPVALSTFTSMLIFNGSKAVTVTYKGATAVDHFVFTPSSVFQYIWRILLLLFIIYVILYIVGFFTTKGLPRGTFVKVTLGEGNDEYTFGVSAKDLNISFKERSKRHFKRLLPWKIFSNEEHKTILGFIDVKFGRGKVANFNYKKTFVELVNISRRGGFGKYFEEFRDKVQKHANGEKNRLKWSRNIPTTNNDGTIPFTIRDFRDLCRVDRHALHERGSSEPYHAKFLAIQNKEGEITNVIFFVPRSK